MNVIVNSQPVKHAKRYHPHLEFSQCFSVDVDGNGTPPPYKSQLNFHNQT